MDKIRNVMLPTGIQCSDSIRMAKTQCVMENPESKETVRKVGMYDDELRRVYVWTKVYPERIRISFPQEALGFRY